MFEPSRFSIILKRDLSLRERELVNRYWEFDNNNLSKFKSTITSLNVEFSDLKLKTHSTISNTVSELAFICTADCKCFQCGQFIEFKTRNDVKHLANRHNLLGNIEYLRRTSICHSCEEINLQDKLDDSIEKIMTTIDEIKNLQENIELDLESLSFLEQLYLSIYLENLSSDGQVIIQKSIISDDCDLQITNSLLEKGYLFDFTTKDSLISDLSEKKAFVQEHTNYLNFDMRDLIMSYIYLIPKSGIYINSAINREFKESLLKNIKNVDKFSYKQFKDIEIIVKTVLVKQAEEIIKTSISHYRVYAIFDEAFRHTMEVATWNYSMRMVCNLVFYETKNMAAEIQAGRVAGQSKYHHLRRRIESRLNYLKENPEAKKYFSDLPDKIGTPAVVKFLIKNFIKDELSWDALSGQDIVAKWLSCGS